MASVDNFAKDIAAELAAYSSEVAEAVKEAVDEVSKEAAEEIKKHITFNQRTGKYIKAFRLKTSYEAATEKRKTWYVASPHYRLTHLLEYGHASRNGGRVKAYPHIKYGEEYAEANLPKQIERKINDIG